jgi:hypothetical protein
MGPGNVFLQITQLFQLPDQFFPSLLWAGTPKSLVQTHQEMRARFADSVPAADAASATAAASATSTTTAAAAGGGSMAKRMEALRANAKGDAPRDASQASQASQPQPPKPAPSLQRAPSSSSSSSSISALAAADLAHAQESAADRAQSDRETERREAEALARLQRDLATGPGNQIVLQISDALHSLQPLLMDSALDHVWRVRVCARAFVVHRSVFRLTIRLAVFGFALFLDCQFLFCALDICFSCVLFQN